MPIVPVEENKVGIAGLTDEKLRPADYSGSGLDALGAGLAGVGKAGAELADSLPGQDEAKRRHAELLRTDLAAKRAWNEALEANAGIRSDFLQLKGDEAGAALGASVAAIKNNFHAVRAGHEGEHVRAILDSTLAPRTAQDIMDLHAHADAQDAIAQAQESERLVANSATEALRHADDPARFDHAIATGENTLRRQGQLAGKPEAAIDGDIAAWRSARYVQAVHALAPNDGLGATALFERYRDQLTPADRAALEPLLHEPMAQTQAIADIDTAALAAAPFAPLTPQGDPLLPDRMRTITSHFDRVVLPELMQRYGGDAARAWAATQIGTDAVDSLVKQHGDGWYQALPEAARHAVAHNFALLNAGTSARAAPQDRAAVEASLAGLDDTRRGYAQRELTLRSNRADQARRAAQGAAADQAYALADQLGHDFTSLAQLPAKVRADLSDQTSAALQRQADANIDPQPVAPEGTVSLALRNMAATAPEAFRDLDMREYRSLVSADEYAMFQRLQRGSTASPDRTPVRAEAGLRPGAPHWGLRDISFGTASPATSASDPAALSDPNPVALPTWAGATEAGMTSNHPPKPAATPGAQDAGGTVADGDGELAVLRSVPRRAPLISGEADGLVVLAAKVKPQNATRLNGRDVIATPEMKAIAQANIELVRVRAGQDEKSAVAFLMPDGTVELRPLVGKGTTHGTVDSGIYVTGKISGPGRPLFIIHGHIEKYTGPSNASPLAHVGKPGMVDDPENPLAEYLGDTHSLMKQRIPVATVYDGYIGWHEMRGGQLVFSAPKAALTKDQIQQLQSNLDQEQKLFLLKQQTHKPK